MSLNRCKVVTHGQRTEVDEEVPEESVCAVSERDALDEPEKVLPCPS